MYLEVMICDHVVLEENGRHVHHRSRFMPILVFQCNVFRIFVFVFALVQAGLWERAIRLLDNLIQAALLPSIVSFNSAINACANWPLAVAFLLRMQQMALQPSIATIGALMGAPALPWRNASQLLFLMTSNQLRPGVGRDDLI